MTPKSQGREGGVFQHINLHVDRNGFEYGTRNDMGVDKAQWSGKVNTEQLMV